MVFAINISDITKAISLVPNVFTWVMDLHTPEFSFSLHS